MEGQYEKVITRILDGVMFHEQMMLYYNFLGLNGYSICHKYHYLSELNSYNSVLEYYIIPFRKYQEAGRAICACPAWQKARGRTRRCRRGCPR